MEKEMSNIHVLQLIVDKIGPTPDLLRIAGLNKQCNQIIRRQFLSYHKGITFDVAAYNETNVILSPKWFEEKSQSKHFHNDIRNIIGLLISFSEFFETDKNTIRNLSPQAVAWNYPHMESAMKRCPALLQKKIVSLIKNKFKGTTEFVYHRSLLRPSRFIKIFTDRLETITKLDLGEMKAIRAVALQKKIFPRLVSLEELVWHAADMWFFEALPNLHLLKKLCITFNIRGFHVQGLQALTHCQGLTHLHTGIIRPPINRLVWHVVLKNYQSFWNQKKCIPESLLVVKGLKPVPIANGAISDYTYKAFPNIKSLSFWDTPEYLFVQMAKIGICLNELQLGLLSQDLQRLCSLDSIMQAFFKFLQPNNIAPLHINHLKINAHSMPVVTLDYYLPNLMMSLQKALPELETLEIFIHCLIQGASMPTSWIHEKQRPKRPKSLFENLKKFSFHIDGYCLLDDLDTYLPDTVQSITLSFVQPVQNKRKFLNSLQKFIKYLGDINRFPELDEFAIQVWGVNCFEFIANTIADNLPSLEKISIIAMPTNTEMSKLKYAIESLNEKCSKLKEFGIANEMVSLLTEGDTKKSHWQNVLFELKSRCNVTADCTLTIKSYPEAIGWNQYIAKPIIQNEEEDENEAEEQDSLCVDYQEEEEDDAYESSFIATDEEEECRSDDELDEIEKALESEDEIGHRRWVKRMNKRKAKSESENSEYSSDEVIVFKSNGECIGGESYFDDDEEDNGKNPFFDDEAEEYNDESEEDETEPEGEDIAETDDDELFEAQAELINMRPRSYEVPKKKRRIIDSDSD